MANRVESPVEQHHRLQSRDPTSRLNATSPTHPPSPARPKEPQGKLAQASGSLMPTPFRTAPIVQKSAYDSTKSLIHGFRLRCPPNGRRNYLSLSVWDRLA